MKISGWTMQSAHVMVITILAVMLAAVPCGAAQTGNGASEAQIKVVGHLALPEIHVNQMFTQNRDGKHYLYLHRPTRQAFALVDVTRADKPVLVEKATLQAASRSTTHVNATNSGLAIAVSPEGTAGATPAPASAGTPAPSVPLPTETVRLLDLSDPTHPKTLKTFAGVTSMLPDDSRKLIYIVNSEGLWIVRHQQVRPMPMCNSEDALIQDPNCQ